LSRFVARREADSRLGPASQLGESQGIVGLAEITLTAGFQTILWQEGAIEV